MGWPSKHQLRRLWRPFRIVAGFVLLGVAVWVVKGKSSELSGASAYLTQLRWEWIALAAVAELACYTSLASVERVLLRAGQVPAGLGRLTAITFAASAIQSALPVGAAFAGVYNFRQYQWLGADEVLSGWVVIASGAVSFVTLAALAGIGLSMAASLGTTLDLVGAIVGVLVMVLLVVIAWVIRARLFRLAYRFVSVLERRLHREPGQLSEPVAVLLERMRAFAPTRGEWALAALGGTASWVADCTCLAAAFLAVGAPVPWQGLLLAYCGGQLAVNLPITPGGLGVVEGSLTIALLLFGGGKAPTVAAVLLYRLFSFWLPMPVGFGCWLGLAERRRRHERALRTESAVPNEPVPNEPVPNEPVPNQPVPNEPGPNEPGAEGQ
jgi:putative heme transporter